MRIHIDCIKLNSNFVKSGFKKEKFRNIYHAVKSENVGLVGRKLRLLS